MSLYGEHLANDGRAALFDERYAQRWLFAPDPAGTGEVRGGPGRVDW